MGAVQEWLNSLLIQLTPASVLAQAIVWGYSGAAICAKWIRLQANKEAADVDRLEKSLEMEMHKFAKLEREETELLRVVESKRARLPENVLQDDTSDSCLLYTSPSPRD